MIVMDIELPEFVNFVGYQFHWHRWSKERSLLTEAAVLLKFTHREVEGLVRNRVCMIGHPLMNATNRLHVCSPTYDFSNRRNQKTLITSVVNLSSSKENRINITGPRSSSTQSTIVITLSGMNVQVSTQPIYTTLLAEVLLWNFVFV